MNAFMRKSMKLLLAYRLLRVRHAKISQIKAMHIKMKYFINKNQFLQVNEIMENS